MARNLKKSSKEKASIFSAPIEFFGNFFSSSISIKKIQKNLLKEMLRACKQRSSKSAPNTFEIFLPSQDFLKLSSRRTLEDLYVYIEKALVEQDLVMEGTLHLVFSEAKEFLVQASYDDEAGRPLTQINHQSSGDTIVLKKTSMYDFSTVPLNLPPIRKFASLTIQNGKEMGTSLEFGEKKVFLGRRQQNDLILSDPSSSRLHAYITYERHRHVLHDASSMNGTYINNHRIKDSAGVRLRLNDEIRIGSTKLIYNLL